MKNFLPTGSILPVFITFLQKSLLKTNKHSLLCLLFILFAYNSWSQAPCTAPAAPAVISPVHYCQNAIAVPLTATGSNLLWGSVVQGSSGGAAILSNTTYIDATYNNKKTNFTTNTPNVTIGSVDYYIPSWQTANGLVLSIYNSSGTIIATSVTNTSMSAAATTIKVSNIFNYLIPTAGNYSIGVSAGSGNIGSDNPSFPITEATGTITVTGVSIPGARCFNNIQFPLSASSTAPTPSTATVGTTNYTVSQTVAGCTSSGATIAVIVTAPPAAIISYSGSPFCKSLVTAQPVTQTGTTGGTYSSTTGLTISPTTGAITPSTSTAGTYTVTYTMAAAGSCPVQTASTTVTIAGLPSVSAVATETCVGGSTGTITASASGSVSPYTYSLNSGAYQSSGIFTGLAAGTYTVNVMSSAGCVASSSVTVNSYPNSADDQNTAGTNSWVGHVYDGINFSSYIGHYTETENFNEFFGGNTTCFNLVSNSLPRSIYTETFSVKYRMNSTKKGLYIVDLGADDGNRLTVDGVMAFNSFTYQSFILRPSVLINLTGNSSLLYEYFENNGNNQAMFQNLTLVLANNLSTNTTQSICVGNTGAAISGDVYGTLPSGISLSGTGYQWSYSTTPGGVRTNISGATAATFTPIANVTPFNTAGVYYVYRNVQLSSANNIAPNPYVATNESNAAVITINAAGQWTGSISTDWSVAGNWCTGAAPTAATNVVISSTATRMPTISNSVNCNSLTINAGATVTTSISGTLNIAGTLTNNGTMNNDGTINFNGTSGQQTFSGVSSFYNLMLSNTSGLLLPAAISINNNLLITAGTLNANNFNIAIKGNWTNNVSTTAFTAGTSTVNFNGIAAQVIGGTFATTFNNLSIANTGNTVSLNTNTIISGDLSVSGGVFDLGAFTANRTSPGGTLTVANNATLRIGGTNTYPANYTNSTLVVASTVEYSGTNQTVSNQLYGNLALSSSGISVKTFPATALTVVGNLSSSLGTGTSLSFTAASNITVNGNVSVGASTIFNGSNYSHTIGGNWINNGTFNGNSSTVSFEGHGASIGGSGIQNFNNLTIAASQVNFSNTSITVNGNLATISSGSFSQASGGTLSMTGTGTTISGSGISLDNLAISGSVSTAISFIINGNLSVSGSFNASAGTITCSGASKTISGTGAKSFTALTVTGSITTNADLSVSSGLTVSGSLSASAGNVTFTGNSTLSGTADLFNTTINGISLQLSAGSILGVANVLSITSGTLNVTSSAPNTVNFNGTGAQNINAITYGNLVLSNGNTKTALGNITTENDLHIGINTSFAASTFTHSVYGNWINSGTFIPATSTVQFLGAATAYLTGVTNFNILTSNTTGTTTELILNNNISAAIVNMTNGIISTGSNTISITNTRTGNGFIYGNIQRTHAFTTGVAYAFEGPDNTITFSAVSAVNSITVSVVEGAIADFPFGGSISRVYNITIPTGTYTANLRLHYEDDELNGNIESSMGLWNYSGSIWNAIGKTANSTVSNYVEQSGLTNINNRWTCSDNSNLVQWNGSVSTDWNTAANWTILQGSASRPPSANDIVNLGTATFTNQPSISTPVSVKNINFGSAKAVSLTMVSGGSLSTGNVHATWSSNATHTINANDQTVSINGDLFLSDGTIGHAIDLHIGSGTVNVAGDINQSGGANIIFSAAGNLNITDNYNYVNGTFTAATGTVSYNGINNQQVAAVNYYNLTINKTAALATINNATAIGGNLAITSGQLENFSNTTILGNVTISSGATLVNNSILHVGGNWANNGNYVGNGVNIIFDGVGTQTISASTFNNLEFNKPVGSLAILAGDVTLKGNLVGTSGTLDIQSFFFNRDVVGGSATMTDAATLIIAADNAPTKFASYYMAPNSTVIFNGTGTQHLLLPGLQYGNLIFRNTGTKILYTPITVNGDLSIESGATFDAGSNTITLNGNWANSGTFTPSASTLLFSGTAKNIAGNTTFNRATITGSYTILNDVTFNGLLNITSAGSLSGGSSIHTTMNGDLINSGILYSLGTTTFTGNVLQTLSLINAVQTVAITVNFNGSVSPVLNSTSPPQYGYLNINNTGGVNPSVGWTIAYGLTVGAGASFNGGPSSHTILGYVNNNGTISSSGTLSFLPSSAVTVNLGNNFTSTGRVYFGGTGAMTLAGNPASFNNVNINNTNVAGITPSSDWNITKDLRIVSGSILNAGNRNCNIGGNILNNGTINCGTSIFNLNGNGNQDIYSLSPFYDLTISKATGLTTLSSNITANGTLHFNSGKIQTGMYSVIQPSAGMVTGASQNTGWVNGNLQKNIATGIIAKTFETGDDNYYAPVSVSFANVTTAGDLAIKTVPGDHPAISSSAINALKSVNRYWNLANSGIGFTNYAATFKYPASDLDAGATAASFGVSVYNGSSWTLPVTGAVSDTSAHATGITSFGDFAIGEICNKGTSILYAASPYCSASGNASVTLLGNTGGVYTSTPGLSINASTGLVSLGTSTPGVYTVTYNLAATAECPAYSTSTNITIDEAPTATGSYTGSPYCSALGGIVYPTGSGTANGVFSSTAGLVIDAVNGGINLAGSTPGTYIVTYTIAASGGCTEYSWNTTVTITAAPAAVISYPALLYCSHSITAAVDLTGTSGGIYSSTVGLSLDAVTGSINLANSIPGIYTVTYTIAASAGCGQFQTSTGITISAFPNYGNTFNLGTTANFVLFTVNGATGNTGTSLINGDIGANAGAITGFGTSVVNGNIISANAVTAQCSTDLMALYTQINNTVPTYSAHAPAFGTGETLFPGVYDIAGAGSVAGELILDAQGDPNALFIFKIGGAFTTGASTTIKLINGASACNVFWKAEGAISMAALTTMKGTLIANNGAISMGAGGILEGRMFSTTGAVSVYAVNASIPACSSIETIWTGAINSDWNVDCNWLYGAIPTTETNITIPHGLTNYPVLNGRTGLVKNITIEHGALLTVTDATLRISGNIMNNGMLYTDYGSIEMNGHSTQVIPASAFANNIIKNLIISNDASLAGIDTLTGTLTIAAGKTFATNDHLILRSDANGTGRIATLPVDASGAATAFITGNVSIERYIPLRKAWRLLSAPLKSSGAPSINAAWQEGVTTASANPNIHPGYGVFIQGGTVANGFDQGLTTATTIKVLSNPLGSFTALSSTGTNASITNYPGYFLYIRGDRSINLLQGNNAATTETTLRMQGQVNTGSQATSVSGAGYTVLGNPFPSAIDFESLAKNNVKNAFYVWDPKLSGLYGLGGYVTFSWNNTTGTYDATTSASQVSKYIPSGEAILIESADGINPGTVTVRESDKTANGSDQVFGRPNSTSQQLRVNLYAVNTDNSVSLLDGVLTSYDDNNSNGIDGYDAKKLNGGSENIAIKRNSSMLAIERRKTITANDTSFLNIYQLKAQSYQLEIGMNNMEQDGAVALLKDSYSNTLNNMPLDMHGTTNVTFNVNADPASYAINRFSIVFVVQKPLPVRFVSVKAQREQHNIAVTWTTAEELNIKEYEVERSADGTNFNKINTTKATATNGGSASYKFLDTDPLNGYNYYRVRSVSPDGDAGYSSIVKALIQDAGTGTSIAVYPNPVVGNTINIEFANIVKGNYTLQLYNISGQLISSKTIQYNGTDATISFEVNEQFAAGKYELKLTGGDIHIAAQLIKR